MADQNGSCINSGGLPDNQFAIGLNRGKRKLRGCFNGFYRTAVTGFVIFQHIPDPEILPGFCGRLGPEKTRLIASCETTNIFKIQSVEAAFNNKPLKTKFSDIP